MKKALLYDIINISNLVNFYRYFAGKEYILWFLGKAVDKMLKKILTVALTFAVFASVVPANAAENNIIKSMNFEEFDEGKALKGTSNWDVKLFEGDECTVVTDEITNSKAIKFIKGATTDNAYIEYSLPSEITSGIVKVSYDVRIESATKYNQIFGAVRNKAWSNFITPRIKGQYLYNGDSAFIGDAKNKIGTDWCHYEQIIDIAGGTVEYSIYKNDKKIMSYSASGLNKGNVMRLIFAAFEDRSWGVNGWECTYQSGTKIPNTSDPKGVIYIDNIIFEKIVISPVSAYPENGSENVSTDSDIKVDFSVAPADDISENIEILKNGDKLNGGFSTTASGNSSIIKIDGGLDFESEYEVTVKAGTPAASASYGVTSSDYTFSFKTENIIPEDIGIKDGGRYNKEAKAEFEDKNGVEISAELKYKDGEFEEYISGAVIDKEGDYVLRLTATKNGKSQVKEISFRVVGLVAPRAEDVTIEADGFNLKGSYKFIDDNGDEEGETTFRWLITDENEEKQVGTGTEYTITEEDDGKIIKFAVTPKSVAEPYEGEEYYSEEYLMPAKPVVEGDVTVTGDIALDAELTVDYKYFDKNGDSEDGAVISWYRTDENGEVKEKIDSASESVYKLTEGDIDCYIVCGVTPKNDAVFGEGTEYFSKPLMLMFSPKAEDVEITGNATAGKSVSASYKFTDENGDKEGKTKTEWYLDDELVSSEAGYSVPKGTSGKLKLVVTPVSQEFPFEGEPVEVTVSVKKASSGGSSGGTGGGGFTVSSGSGAVNLNPTVAEEKEEVKESEREMLSDISGHWSEENVMSLFDKGIITGDENNKFNPDKKITRAEMAALIVRALNLSEEYKNLYTDVRGGEWFAEIVCAVSSAGIMKGDKVSFRPGDYITREELCVVVSNILKYKNIDVVPGKMNFADEAEISDWAKESVMTAVGMKLVQGMGQNRMSPKSSATKAQAAVIIDKILQLD